MGLNDLDWLDKPEHWRKLARVLRRAGIFGLDTEFYNVDVRKESCVGKARVHVWSVAVRSNNASPLGFHRARGWVLPAEALLDPHLKAVLEDASVTKCVHNQPVDDHAIHNHGVDIKGCLNTLGLARWKWPELKTGGGFGLKNLMGVKLNRDIVCEFLVRKPTEDWWGLVNYQRLDKWTVTKTESKKFCTTCNDYGCRKRKGHEPKVDRERTFEVHKEKLRWATYELQDIVPGHPRWELLLEYAAEDAVAALEIEELARMEPDPAPWPPWGGEEAPRPAFSQGVEDEVVLMERAGFPVDVPRALELLEVAKADEQKCLRWLFKWYRLNGPYDMEREEVDKIWTSPARLVPLLDYLGAPRSPIWKKGRVKPGEVKTDETAMRWVMGECPPLARFIEKFLHLKRIRSGKKYLVKMAGSGGWVHTICGPAGDSDDRNGAITGRLGIKGVLEAQQLPKEGERDLYKIRSVIVANAVESEASSAA